MAKTKHVQLQRLHQESPSTPATNEQVAVARALTGLRAIWGLLGIVFVVVGLALQLTVGVCVWSPTPA